MSSPSGSVLTSAPTQVRLSPVSLAGIGSKSARSRCESQNAVRGADRHLSGAARRAGRGAGVGDCRGGGDFAEVSRRYPGGAAGGGGGAEPAGQRGGLSA